MYAELRKTTRSGFSTLLSAVAFFLPRVRGALPCAHATLNGWEHLEPVSHTMPMLRVFALAIAVRLAAMSFATTGSALILGQILLLRPSELLALQIGDVTLPEHAPVFVGERKLFVNLGRTPWGTKVNRRQVVSTSDPVAIEAARALVAAAGPDGRLCNFSYATFRTRLQKACQELGLTDLAFTPHSMRAGGATQLLMEGFACEKIQAAGRWASPKSCKIYLDAVFALAQSTSARARRFLPLLALPHLPPALGRAV